MEKKTQKEIVEMLFKEKDNYQQATNGTRAEINEIHEVFMGQLNDPKDASKSQEKIMKLRTEVNYIVPSIFSGQPEIEVEPVGEEDKDFALVAEKIINYRLRTIPQAYEKIEAWVKQAVVFGTSLMKVVWKIELEDKEEPEMDEEGNEVLDEEGKPKMKAYQVPSVDQPDLEIPNILDCYFNPIIADVEGQSSLIFRSVVPVDSVKGNQSYDAKDDEGNLNRDKVESKQNIANDKYNSSTQVTTDLIDSQKASVGTVEIYERVTDEGIQTVADGKERILLRDTKWDYDSKCAVKLLHEPMDIPNRFEGLGVGHNTLGISRMIQKLSNRLQDAVNLGNNPHFLARKGAGIDKRQLVVAPGGMTEVDGEDSLSDMIVPLQVPDIKNGALELLGRFDDEHKRASGANDLIQGAASNKTLGQDEIASSYSASRFELINRRFKQAIADLAEIILTMEIRNMQSMDSEILRIFPIEAELQGGNIVYSRETVYQMLISEDAKNAKYNIRVKGNTNVAKNKDIQIKQLVDMYNLFGPILPPQNQMEWARKMLELRGIDELDKLIPDPEVMQMPPEEQMIDGQAMSPIGAMPQQPQI